jgi:hypothetical protein
MGLDVKQHAEYWQLLLAAVVFESFSTLTTTVDLLRHELVLLR